MVTTGIAKFVYLDSTETYNGEDTGRWSLTIALDSAEAKKLSDAGVKVRSYTDKDTGKEMKIRKFSTQYKLDDSSIQTKSGDTIGSDFGAESEVSVLWKPGNAHPTHGVATYLTAIKVADDHTPGYKSADGELSEFLTA